MDVWHRATEWMDQNRWTLLCLVVAIAVAIPVVHTAGMSSKTTSVIDPTKEVSRDELEREVIVIQRTIDEERIVIEAEIEILNRSVVANNALIEQGLSDLNRQDELRAEFLSIVSTVVGSVVTGQFNVAALIPGIIGLGGLAFGIGKTVDNRRKDKLITTLKSS